MLLYLFLFLSFAQVGLFGLGSDAGAQALLEHEVITLHHWLTPGQMADMMAFCRLLPGGTGVNAATLSGSLAAAGQFGFGGAVLASLLSVIGLVLPAAAWTAIISKIQSIGKFDNIFECVMTLLRPLVPGLAVAAAIIMMRAENFGNPMTTPWDFWVSVFLFVATLIGVGVYRFHAGFMVLLCGVAGWILF